MEMKTKVLDKKHLLIIVISIFSIIISYFNVTYAYFSDTKNQPISIKSVNTFGESTVYEPNVFIEGNLSYTNKIKNNQTLSFTKDNVDTHDYLLTVATQVEPHTTEYELDEYTSISYEIYHKTQEDLDTSSFTCTEGKYNNGTSEDACNTGTFIENSLNGLPFELLKDYRITDTNTHYFDVYIYLNNDTTSKMFKTRIFYLDKEVERPKTLEEVKTFIANNEPDLNTGLIPVVYDDTKGTDTHWFVADTSKAWYDYESQWWANAISVDSVTEGVRSKYVNTDGTYNTGVEIATSDMLAMFVWIPRYSYTIGCTSESSCLGYKIEGASDLATATPGAIDIKFVDKDTNETYTGDSPTYTYTSEADRNPTNYYTHPAFNFGNDKLSGIWVGKFETSVNPNSTCYDNLINKSGSADSNCVASKEDVTPRILPNVLSLVRQNVYDEFETAKKFASNTMYGLTNKTDSHMMKNSEWGAVVYLSQSIYGKYGNPNYTEKNKEIYKNDSGTTDYWSRYTGRSQGVAPATNKYYLEGTYKYDDISITDGTKEANKGTGASTTGNIYGIYDMVGGAFEYVMGNYGTETDGVFKGTVASSGITFSDIDIKYYDKLTTTKPSTTKSNETIGQAYVETAIWYSDDKRILEAYAPWVQRGGSFSNDSLAGAFYLDFNLGSGNHNFSFHSVLATIE